MSEEKAPDSLEDLFQAAWTQIQEDRVTLKTVYDDLRTKMSEKEDYAINGANLGKFAELLLKNTSQVVELIKITEKKEKKEEITSFTDEDLDSIKKEIETEVEVDEH